MRGDVRVACRAVEWRQYFRKLFEEARWRVLRMRVARTQGADKGAAAREPPDSQLSQCVLIDINT